MEIITSQQKKNAFGCGVSKIDQVIIIGNVSLLHHCWQVSSNLKGESLVMSPLYFPKFPQAGVAREQPGIMSECDNCCNLTVSYSSLEINKYHCLSIGITHHHLSNNDWCSMHVNDYYVTWLVSLVLAGVVFHAYFLEYRCSNLKKAINNMTVYLK